MTKEQLPLVFRLRETCAILNRRPKADFDAEPLMLEAADEIERLQALMLKQTQLNTKMWDEGFAAGKRSADEPPDR